MNLTYKKHFGFHRVDDNIDCTQRLFSDYRKSIAKEDTF